jgi:hypothetical protein
MNIIMYEISANTKETEEIVDQGFPDGVEGPDLVTCETENEIPE